MPHSAELNEKIRCLVEQDYSSTQYQYQIEKAIRDTRMHQDLRARRDDGAVSAAVFESTNRFPACLMSGPPVCVAHASRMDTWKSSQNNSR